MSGLLASFLMRFPGYHNDSTPVLILGSFYACLYYGFYCEPRHRIAYMLLITFSGLGAWASFNHARRHNLFYSGGVHRFESRICKTNPPPRASWSFSRTGPIRNPTSFSLIALSWTIHPSPRYGLYLAPSCGCDVYHGCPTIVSLFPATESPDTWLIWLGPQLAHVEFQRDSTLVDSTISFRLIKSSIYLSSSLLFRRMSVC
jgi:hypothetical protein